jgi:8-oxo-dGTP pyrophosphatase MutT (NUDIX family)
MNEPLTVDGENPWRTRSTRVLYDNGLMRLCEDAVVQPDGEQGRYTYVDVPLPVVAIVAVSDDGHVYLVRQWRYPWRRNSWEIPAGRAELDEVPLQSAQRELAEEVGLQAATWETLGTGYMSTIVNARYHLFLARSLSPSAPGFERDGAEHDLIARPLRLDAAVEAAMDGRIEHGLSVVGLLRAARRLGV